LELNPDCPLCFFCYSDAIRAQLWGHHGRKLLERHDWAQKEQEQDRLPKFSAFQLWLKDLQLESYEESFLGVGFRVIDDFVGLNLLDCQVYFPFLLVGDIRRLCKHIQVLNPHTVADYQYREGKKDTQPTPLPPIGIR
jgi:hypothetical protein